MLLEDFAGDYADALRSIAQRLGVFGRGYLLDGSRDIDRSGEAAEFESDGGVAGEAIADAGTREEFLQSLLDGVVAGDARGRERIHAVLGHDDFDGSGGTERAENAFERSGGDVVALGGEGFGAGSQACLGGSADRIRGVGDVDRFCADRGIDDGRTHGQPLISNRPCRRARAIPALVDPAALFEAHTRTSLVCRDDDA